MKQAIVIIIGLAMLTAAPLGAIAQETGSGVGEPAPIEPAPPIDDPWNYTDPYWYYWPVMGGFEYSGGVANGTYVDFILDESTGEITEYVSTIVDYNYFYPMVFADGRVNGDDAGGNGATYEWAKGPTTYVVNWFDSITIDGFAPNGSPFVFRESLVFVGGNVMATLTDYEYASISYQFGEGNSTLTFTVPDGIEISESPRYYEMYSVEPVNITDSAYDDMSVDYGGAVGSEDGLIVVPNDPDYRPWEYQWDEAYLTMGNLSCSIWVDRGSVDIVDRQIIIHTYPGASVSTSSWIDYGWTYQYAYEEPWFEDIPSEDDKGAVEQAMEDGLMAAVGYLFQDEAGAQYDDAKRMNDPTFQLEFMNVEQNRFQVQVDSDIEQGRIVTLNVNKDALQADDINQIKVLLDNEDCVACDSMEELVDMQGGAEAGYYMVSGNSQNTVFVYVPHFSTHVITVELADFLGGGLLVPGLLAAAFIAAAVGLVAMRAKRNKDDL
jgi:major membrane immunogen (membrane-anchored lipoprotein)